MPKTMPKMTYAKTWANKETFKLKPMKQILQKYVGSGANWIDPFAGNNSPAEYTNDLNLNTNAKYHMEATDFIKMIAYKGPFDGILYDPPYSPTQVKICYEGVGLKNAYKNDCWYLDLIKQASPLIKRGGLAISFGWSSNGFGKYKGFELIEIVLVSHGYRHNDTIITVEKKMDGVLA